MENECYPCISLGTTQRLTKRGVISRKRKSGQEIMAAAVAAADVQEEVKQEPPSPQGEDKDDMDEEDEDRDNEEEEIGHKEINGDSLANAKGVTTLDGVLAGILPGGGGPGGATSNGYVIRREQQQEGTTHLKVATVQRHRKKTLFEQPFHPLISALPSC